MARVVFWSVTSPEFHDTPPPLLRLPPDAPAAEPVGAPLPAIIFSRLSSPASAIIFLTAPWRG